nr:hypothetical protein [Kibdelosporangium sp. MJ126-NF4]CTQ92364.1 hypothetical protein [Kibdelosporangium sp. MJ126-NF4]
MSRSSEPEPVVTRVFQSCQRFAEHTPMPARHSQASVCALG